MQKFVLIPYSKFIKNHQTMTNGGELTASISHPKAAPPPKNMATTYNDCGPGIYTEALKAAGDDDGPDRKKGLDAITQLPVASDYIPLSRDVGDKDSGDMVSGGGVADDLLNGPEAKSSINLHGKDSKELQKTIDKESLPSSDVERPNADALSNQPTSSKRSVAKIVGNDDKDGKPKFSGGQGIDSADRVDQRSIGGETSAHGGDVAEKSDSTNDTDLRGDGGDIATTIQSVGRSSRKRRKTKRYPEDIYWMSW